MKKILIYNRRFLRILSFNAWKIWSQEEQNRNRAGLLFILLAAVAFIFLVSSASCFDSGEMKRYYTTGEWFLILIPFVVGAAGSILLPISALYSVTDIPKSNQPT
jgi:hypothetical protein